MIDRYTKAVLTVIAVMLTLVAMGLWTDERPSVVSRAYAGIPDSGQQLQQIVDSVDAIQARMDSLSAVLVSGKIKVEVVEPKVKAKPDEVK